MIAHWAAAGLTELLLWQSGITDPQEEARSLPGGLPVLAIRAREDRFVPRECVEALDQALSQSRAQLSLKQTSGGHLQPGAAQTLTEVGGLIRPWLEVRDPSQFAPTARGRWR